MDKLEIHTLGEFYITYGDAVLNEHSKRSKKMWMLLQYLIAFHDRELNQNELIDLLWPKGESNNPVGALKTQLYRLRSMLTEAGMPGDKIIINTMGTYAFNNSFEFAIDADLFESEVKKSAGCFSEKEKLACYLKAIDLYKGDFLVKSAGEQWAMPLCAYYHSMYIKVVHSALETLFSFRRYAEVIEISRRAIVIDQLDETLHSYLMKALVANGAKSEAKSHYLYVLDLFYNHEGINPSQTFVSLYNEIMKTENTYSADVASVRIEMEEKNAGDGAFYCEYEAFKYIYQLEVRESARSKKPVYLCVITVSDGERNPLTPKQQNHVMQKLSEVIRSGLRNSDVFARYSASQFVLIFPGASDEICGMILQRIVRQYKRDNSKSKVLMLYSYEPVEIKHNNIID